MTPKVYKRNIFQRMMGKPMTVPPADAGCWSYSNGRLTIDLARTPELAEPWGAINLAAESLPNAVLVMRDGAGVYRAFCNKCSHGGRLLDPVPGTETVCCCSMGKSTFDYEGNVLSGSAEKPISVYAVEVQDGKVIVAL
ncbi:MAG: Rieske 2Fe-2S domain-containing protein [Ardenticatenaceae bacterium]|nr:Rieske 2Fe-2S domain-containing protein [Ardenticatenaceae bacterium]